ncbi:MAG: CBS domain-containing protein [Gammaproteobacteria bacterium]
MQVKDIMTTNVVTVGLDTRVEQIAALLLERRISGVPVVDAENRVLGIVSEGDLLRRQENDTDYRASWWLEWFNDSGERAAQYVKTHGLRAEQVMTRNVVTVTEEMSVADVARILEERRIKRAPVVRAGQLVGIVSRANLLHGLVAHKNKLASQSVDDHTLRENILATLKREGWLTHGLPNVTVSDGVVALWAWVDSEAERQALLLAVERVAGVRAVDNHIALIPPYSRAT